MLSDARVPLTAVAWLSVAQVVRSWWPALTWLVNACHISGVNASFGPSGSLLSRTATTRRRLEASTQLPPLLLLRVALRHSARLYLYGRFDPYLGVIRVIDDLA